MKKFSAFIIESLKKEIEQVVKKMYEPLTKLESSDAGETNSNLAVKARCIREKISVTLR